MKKIIYIYLLAVLMAACGTNNSQVDKIKVEIPEALADNRNAKELIEDMTEAVNTCRNNMAVGAKFAIEQEKSGSDSLTFKQGFKAAKFAAKMMFAARKIEKIRDEAQELKPQLSQAEWTALETKLDELETRTGDLNPEDLGLSEEELAKFKEAGELHIGKEQNEIRDKEVMDKNAVSEQQNMEDGLALRETEESIMQSVNANNEAQQADGNSEGGFGWIGILFVILVFVLIIFRGKRKASRYKQQIKNVSKAFFK